MCQQRAQPSKGLGLDLPCRKYTHLHLNVNKLAGLKKCRPFHKFRVGRIDLNLRCLLWKAEELSNSHLKKRNRKIGNLYAK